MFQRILAIVAATFLFAACETASQVVVTAPRPVRRARLHLHHHLQRPQRPKLTSWLMLVIRFILILTVPSCLKTRK